VIYTCKIGASASGAVALAQTKATIRIRNHTEDNLSQTILLPDSHVGATNRTPIERVSTCALTSPGHLKPARVGVLASQIDVAPTLLALLNVSYTSRFFGQDILTEGQHHQRALMANYLTVGYVEDDLLVELSPKRRHRIVDAKSGRSLSQEDPRTEYTLAETIAHFQVATDVLRGR
jgi:hypothetical protein